MELKNQVARSAIVQPPMREAKFAIGQVVKHHIYPFRGVIFDVDPVFANTEEWLASIPIRICPAGRGNLRLAGNSAIFAYSWRGPWSVAHWRH